MSGRPVEERAPGLVSDETARRLFLGLLAILLLLIACTFRDYGITWDEEIQSRYGRTLLRWYATLARDDSATHFGNLYLYGGFFETLAEFVSQFSPLGHFETRHLVGALFGTVTFLAAFKAGVELSGPKAGLFAAILLVLNPLFYGHLFANSKDSPFAAAFMAALYLILASRRVLAFDRDPPTTALGLAIGMTAGIRVWGLALLGLLAIFWGASGFLMAREPSSPGGSTLLRRIARSFFRATLIAWLVMTAAWPWVALDPLTRPFKALFATATLHPESTLLFRGRIVPSGALPWDYVFTWLAITLPEVHLLALLVGLILAFGWLRRSGWWKSAAAASQGLPLAWLTLVTAAPLLLFVLARPFLYDGIRHLLFVLPPLCVLGGVGLAAVMQGSWPASIKALSGLVVMVLSAVTVADMVELHPYQTVYFNRALAGGLQKAARRYDTDYWGSSYKEGVEWLARNYEPPSTRPVRLALLGDPLQLTYYLARSEHGRRFVVREGEIDPHVLLITRNNNRFARIKGTLLHTVDRLETPLLFIFEIRRPPLAPSQDPPSR